MQNTTGKQGKRKSMAQLKPLQLARSRRDGNPGWQNGWQLGGKRNTHSPLARPICMPPKLVCMGLGGKRRPLNEYLNRTPKTRTPSLLSLSNWMMRITMMSSLRRMHCTATIMKAISFGKKYISTRVPICHRALETALALDYSISFDFRGKWLLIER